MSLCAPLVYTCAAKRQRSKKYLRGGHFLPFRVAAGGTTMYLGLAMGGLEAQRCFPSHINLTNLNYEIAKDAVLKGAVLFSSHRPGHFPFAGAQGSGAYIFFGITPAHPHWNTVYKNCDGGWTAD